MTEGELTTRYDLNAMFKKSFGRMTVNVQGLSRVWYFSTHPSITIIVYR